MTINRGEFVKWSWKAPVGINVAFKIQQTDSPSSTSASTNGFSSGQTPQTSGTFQYQFNTLGTFYYWSGFVDSNGQIALRGVINVQDSQDVDLPINLSVGAVQGLFSFSAVKFYFMQIFLKNFTFFAHF